MVLLTKWNRPVAVTLAGAVGLAAAMFLPPVVAQRQTEVAAGDAPSPIQPGALPQPPEDKEKQAKKALEEAEARLKEAQEKLRDAQANYEKAKAAKNAVVWGATLQQLQGLNWVFIGEEATTRDRTIRVRSSDYHGLRPNQRIDTTFLTLFLAKDVKVFIDGQEGKVTDLGRGMQLSLRLAENQPEVTRIDAVSNKRVQEQVIKEVDAAKKTISVTIGGKVILESLPVAGAEISISPDSENSNRTLDELKPGMRVTLYLSIEDGRIVVKEIQARK